MSQNRRQFIQKTLAGLTVMSLAPQAFSGRLTDAKVEYQSKPWIELSKAAYLHNASQISRMSSGKPVMAVLKNNAYGLGAVEVAQSLERSSHVLGLAVVKDTQALEMRYGGASKPILLMGDFEIGLSEELVNRGIVLSVHGRSSLEKIKKISQDTDHTVQVALYIDTGLGRMGIPYEQVDQIAEEIHQSPRLRISQTFSTLVTSRDFAEEQISRFENITSNLIQKGISLGLKHLAPSYSLLDLPKSHQDVVRPGILLHGSFPISKMSAADQYPLQVAYRLKAPVIRLEKLRTGDTIGFSRFYKVKQDEWIATLPIGWADGYDSRAENGAKVLLGNKLCTVVNVNASHANVSLGDETNVKVGDVATLIGPERPEITPEGFGNLIEAHNYLQINYKESIAKHVYERF